MAEPLSEPASPMAVQAPGPVLPPLDVSGILLTRAQLIQALRIYLPHLADVQPLEGKDAFLLIFGQDSSPIAEGADHA